MLKIDNINLERKGRAIFSNISADIDVGELLAVKGNSGSGKTILLDILAGKINISEGEISYNNSPIKKNKEYKKLTLYIEHDLKLSEKKTVLQNIEFDAKINGTKELVDAALHYFNLADIHKYKISELSRGHKQLVALTRLITVPSKIWLLDEPTTNLDENGVNLFHSLMQSRLEQKGIIIMATHSQFEGNKIKELLL